ncbi:gfo/Idh/MocA family oxidoreductase, partial [Campylobacter jejuni]|nr:gfo/Idh/MocA family oxidoreductase [Campylobacter jejuni]
MKKSKSKLFVFLKIDSMKIGIIGLGKMGQNHLNELSKN